MEVGRVYCGGYARMVEECFAYGGQQVMYIGDHIYADTTFDRISEPIDWIVTEQAWACLNRF
ncbi:unnamed protein product [Durusdinium trenchii]|uniref:Uncharacterized protein n=2 Tax=Durusdinium trenchii TaxID=1381693 RepID=A0ABP0N2X8_9DINO